MTYQKPNKNMIPRVIPAIRRCIYCLREGVPLGREHVIPEGLGGTLIILKACCRKCEDAIRKFEQPCIRQTFESPRTYLRIKSKRKHIPRNRRLRVGARAASDSDRVWTTADFDDFPFTLAFPKFDPPPLLSGVIKNDDRHIIQKIEFWLAPGALAKMHSTKEETSVFTPIRIGDLFSLIAKIGHGFAVSELGLDGFKPLVTNMIRGIPDDLSNSLVGRSEEQPPSTSALHELAIRMTDEYVTVLVQLFAPINAPTFQAVVGRRLQ